MKILYFRDDLSHIPAETATLISVRRVTNEYLPVGKAYSAVYGYILYLTHAYLNTLLGFFDLY